MKMQKAYNTWTINIKYCVVFLIFTIIACTNHANIKHKGAYIDIENKEIEVGALKMEIVLDVSEMEVQNPFIREFYIKSNAVNGKETIISLTGSIIK